MRRCLAEVAGQRIAALVGSFHAAALLGSFDAAALVAGEPDDRRCPARRRATDPPVPATDPDVRGDRRHGRDLAGAVHLRAAGRPVRATRPGSATRSGSRRSSRRPAIRRRCGPRRSTRWSGSAAGCVPPVTRPVRPRPGRRSGSRVDLARLRGLPAPGRGELVEALQSVLAHGEVSGRGRVVAAAMERVMVGDRRGRLATGTPRSGLGPAVHDLLAELRLPGPGDPSREVRLDPLRSELDRRREVALQRLAACDIPYGEAVESVGVGGLDTITARWRLRWSPQTDAMLDVAGLRGVTSPRRPRARWPSSGGAKWPRVAPPRVRSSTGCTRRPAADCPRSPPSGSPRWVWWCRPVAA